MIDIYFKQDYGKLYEDHENGICEVFEFNNAFGRISHMFIKRKISTTIDDANYFDLITPYGYGGPVIIECKQGGKDKLIKEFKKAFQQYCRENNIITEFIRFHPIINNSKDFADLYNITFMRKTVGTSISSNEDPMMSEFSRSTRKSVRRALRSGVTYKVISSPESIEDFLKIYYSTMDRNKATDYYYFDEKYFHNCMKYFKDNIILIKIMYEDKTIAMSFNFKFKKTIHVHLSGTLSDYLHLSPAYIIKYATALWAKENGIELIHYGGGTTNSENDSLYQFKRKFTKDTIFKYYIGKRIWNKDVYRKLCKEKNIDKNISFFPAYRYKE